VCAQRIIQYHINTGVYTITNRKNKTHRTSSGHKVTVPTDLRQKYKYRTHRKETSQQSSTNRAHSKQTIHPQKEASQGERDNQHGQHNTTHRNMEKKSFSTPALKRKTRKKRKKARKKDRKAQAIKVTETIDIR
jgi:hypothetical protein